VAFVDIDGTLRQTYGCATQGTGRGYAGVNGLNALPAAISARDGLRITGPSTTSARTRPGWPSPRCVITTAHTRLALPAAIP
jgi:hypothetical protein